MRDLFHEAVKIVHEAIKIALEKEGWVITDDPVKEVIVEWIN